MTKRHLFALSLVPLLASYSRAATFGTVVPVRGTPSDIALDEPRGRLYVASLAAKRIDVVNTADLTFGASLSVPLPPSAVALSPSGRFLVAGLYNPYPEFPATAGGVTIFDLDNGARRDLVSADPVLAVSFGAGERALVVTTSEFLLLDPEAGLTEKLGVAALAGQPLPVELGTFPPDIVRAATGVSGDGKSIVILAEVTWPPEEPPVTAILQYRVGDADVKVLNFTTSPPMGPRAVSVNQDGSRFVAGWVLMDRDGHNHAQFPYVTGDLRKGGHAYDYLRNRIYADVPVPNGGEEKVLHVMATDNLAVRGMETENPAGRERIQLPQAMAGRSVFTSDMQTLYAISDSGVMVLPVGALSKARRVAAVQEDVLFQGDSCNRRVITQSLDIVDMGGGSTDFKLSLPTGTAGVRLLQTSGVTPARVQIEVDPTAFQNAKGTTAITLNIESSKAVNIPMPVRLLINTRDFDQRGTLVNVPGKVVDLVADRARNRFYMVRQDTNEVLVYDGVTMSRVGDSPSLRTGNTPMGMAFTSDGRYMLVGNDNSQYISVFDLDTMQPSDPIWFSGHYPRMVAVGNGGIWATARPAGDKSHVFRINFETRTATAPYSLGIYCNNFGEKVCDKKTFNFAESTLAGTPSGNYIVLSTPDGETALWDAGANEWVLSRNDLGKVTGAYGALSDNRFVIGENLLDESLYPIAKLQTDTGATSGTTVGGGSALRTTARAAAAPGTLERLDLEGLQSFHATSIIEAPVTAATLNTPRIGQIGQTILPFTRTLAVVENRPLLLSQSGLSVVAPDFDAPTTVPSVTAVASLADYVSGVAPGGLVAIQGKGLAPKSAVAESLPLPTALGEACATVNNVALPLFRVSPTEFAAQLPYSVVGNAQLVVRSPGGVSAPYPVQIQNAAPAIFRSGTAGDQTGLATVVRDKNGQLVNFTNPIHPGETITVFLTGMGRTSPEPALGDAAPLNPLAMVTNTPAVTIGGVSLPLIYAGLTPGNVGVYQINAWIPGAVRSASQTPLLIQQGAASTSVQVRVVNP